MQTNTFKEIAVFFIAPITWAALGLASSIASIQGFLWFFVALPAIIFLGKNRYFNLAVFFAFYYGYALSFIHESRFMIQLDDAVYVSIFYFIAIFSYTTVSTVIFALIMKISEVQFGSPKQISLIALLLAVVFSKNVLKNGMFNIHAPSFIDTAIAAITPIRAPWLVDVTFIFITLMLCLSLARRRNMPLLALAILLCVSLLFPYTVGESGNTLAVSTLDSHKAIVRDNYEVLRTIDDFELALNHAEKLPNGTLLLLPEGFLSNHKTLIDRLYGQKISALEQKNIKLYAGLNYKHQQRQYNAMQTLGSDSYVYKKKNLTPIGEKPFSIFGYQMTLKRKVTAAKLTATGPIEQKPLHHNGYTFATAICFDLLFETQVMADLRDTDALLVSANLAWFRHSTYVHDYMRKLARYYSWRSAKPVFVSLNIDSSSPTQTNTNLP